MDGGIDLYLSKLFPKIQLSVQTGIKRYNIRLENSGMFMLPIGSAIIVPIEKCICKTSIKYLISAPTMETPQKIDGTENIYYAFFAILKLCNYFKNKTIAIPGLGTLTGGISPEECAYLFLIN